MSYVPLEKLIDKTGGSVYKLVILAAARALEIAEGLPPLIENVDKQTKCTRIALEEIAAGKVSLKKD